MIIKKHATQTSSRFGHYILCVVQVQGSAFMYHTSLSTMIPPEKKKGEILKVNNNIYYVLKEGKDQFLEAKNNKN